MPSKLTILRRCTLVLGEPVANSRLNALAANYDIFAIRANDEKTLQNACNNLDSDLISLDLSQRFPFHFKFPMFSEAVKRGIRLEICYAQGILGDSNARRNVISNATAMIRASRGRGIVIGSEARKAVACRGPWDVINLAAIWGLAQDKGYEAVSKSARSVVVSAKLKRTGYRGVVDIVHGGEKPDEQAGKTEAGVDDEKSKKRKADELDGEKSLSKREKKRRAKVAREQGGEANRES